MERAGLVRITVVAVAIVVVLGAAFLVGGVVLAPAPIGAIDQRQGAEGTGSPFARTPGVPLESLAEVEAFLSACQADIREGDLLLDGEALERLHEVLCNPRFAAAWERVLDLSCINGRSDVSSDYVLDFIERVTRSVPASNVNVLSVRCRAIASLGLTGGKRAEAFLLSVYEDPERLGLAGEMDERDAQVYVGLAGPPPPAYGTSLILKGKAMFALCLLDAAKFSPMIEDDYTAVKNELRAVLERTREDVTNASSPREQRLDALYGVYVDTLVLRDLMGEYGAAGVYFLSADETWRLMAPGTSDYSDWMYEYIAVDGG